LAHWKTSDFLGETPESHDRLLAIALKTSDQSMLRTMRCRQRHSCILIGAERRFKSAPLGEKLT
jgi:hypothetical protein